MKLFKLIWYAMIIIAIVGGGFTVFKYAMQFDIYDWLGVLGAIIFVVYIILIIRREMTDPKARRGRR